MATKSMYVKLVMAFHIKIHYIFRVYLRYVCTQDLPDNLAIIR